MKRILCLAFVVLLAGLAFAMRPAEGQDNLQERVSALETQVAELQSQVAELQPKQATPNVPTKPQAIETNSITGTVTLTGSPASASLNGVVGDIYPADDVGGCYGYEGFSDLVEGASIVVRDGAGAILATSQLGRGTYPDINVLSVCVFTFEISNVPDAEFYQLQIADRSPVTVSREDLVAQSWEIHLTLSS